MRKERIDQDIYVTWQGKYVGEQYLDNTQNADRSMPAYVVNDVLLRYVYKHQKGYEFSIGVAVNNVLDERYVSNGYTFGYIYETRVTERFYYPQAARNVMVNVGVGL